MEEQENHNQTLTPQSKIKQNGDSYQKSHQKRSKSKKKAKLKLKTDKWMEPSQVNIVAARSLREGVPTDKRWIEDTKPNQDIVFDYLLERIILPLFNCCNKFNFYYPCCNCFTRCEANESLGHTKPIDPKTFLLEEEEVETINNIRIRLLAKKRPNDSKYHFLKRKMPKMLKLLKSYELERLRAFVEKGLPRDEEGYFEFPCSVHDLHADCSSQRRQRIFSWLEYRHTLFSTLLKKRPAVEPGEEQKEVSGGGNELEKYAENVFFVNNKRVKTGRKNIENRDILGSNQHSGYIQQKKSHLGGRMPRQEIINIETDIDNQMNRGEPINKNKRGGMMSTLRSNQNTQKIESQNSDLENFLYLQMCKTQIDSVDSKHFEQEIRSRMIGDHSLSVGTDSVSLNSSKIEYLEQISMDLNFRELNILRSMRDKKLREAERLNQRMREVKMRIYYGKKRFEN